MRVPEARLSSAGMRRRSLREARLRMSEARLSLAGGGVVPCGRRGCAWQEATMSMRRGSLAGGEVSLVGRRLSLREPSCPCQGRGFPRRRRSFLGGRERSVAGDRVFLLSARVVLEACARRGKGVPRRDRGSSLERIAKARYRMSSGRSTIVRCGRKGFWSSDSFPSMASTARREPPALAMIPWPL